MPVNNIWEKKGNTFHYKAQDYRNSCFSACLQMALENLYVIGPMKLGQPGRPIEDNFNYYVWPNNLDDAAPDVQTVNRYMMDYHFFGRDKVEVAFIGLINDFQVEQIREQIRVNVNIAVIGALTNGGGHAVMIIKKEGLLYAVDPCPREGIPYFKTIELDDIQELEDPISHITDGIQVVDAGFWVDMNYCYIITRRRNPIR